MRPIERVSVAPTVRVWQLRQRLEQSLQVAKALGAGQITPATTGEFIKRLVDDSQLVDPTPSVTAADVKDTLVHDTVGPRAPSI